MKPRPTIALVVVSLATLLVAAAGAAASGASVSAEGSIGASTQSSGSAGASGSGGGSGAQAGASIGADIDIDTPDVQAEARDLWGDIRSTAEGSAEAGAQVGSSAGAYVGITSALNLQARAASIIDQLDGWCQAQAAADASLAWSLVSSNASAAADIGELCRDSYALIDAAGGEASLAVTLGSDCDPEEETDAPAKDEPSGKDGNAAKRFAKGIWKGVRGVFSR